MSSRQITDLGEYVTKSIPNFSEIEHIKFPGIEDKEGISNLLENTSLLCKSAVIQQYNEYVIYNNWRGNNVLAPIINVKWDERNLPILIYPKFIPLIEDDNFYKLSDEENFVKLGIMGAYFGYDFEYISNFIQEVRDVCEEFNLREDDIFYNLSNIGFNSQYGLRIIDYGLADDNEIII